MAILSVHENAGRSAEVGIGGAGSAQRSFIVVSSVPNELESAVLSASAGGVSIPQEGFPHPGIPRFHLKTKSATQGSTEAERKKWGVVCNYGVMSNDEQRLLQHPWGPSSIGGAPVSSNGRRAKIRANGVRILEPLLYDVEDNKPIVNTALKLYDPPIMVDRSHRVLTITKTKRFAAGVLGLQYSDAVNSDTFLGAEPETLKIQDFSEDGPEYEEFGGVEVEYWTWTVSMEYNPRKWTFEPLNQGRHELRTSGAGVQSWRPIYEKDGNTPISIPVPLDINGTEIPAANLPGAALFGVYKGPGLIKPAKGYIKLPFGALDLLP